MTAAWVLDANLVLAHVRHVAESSTSGMVRASYGGLETQIERGDFDANQDAA